MQTMGDSPVQINQLAPFLLMDDDADDSNLMLMILLNMMNGGMNTQVGFQDNFNLMMPLLLTDDCSDETDADMKKACEKKQKDLLVSFSVDFLTSGYDHIDSGKKLMKNLDFDDGYAIPSTRIWIWFRYDSSNAFDGFWFN